MRETSCDDEGGFKPTRLGAVGPVGSKGDLKAGSSKGSLMAGPSLRRASGGKGRRTSGGKGGSGKWDGSGARGSKVGLQLDDDEGDMVPKELAPPYRGWISSFAEGKSMGLCVTQPRQWINHNLHNFSRIYPKGTRVDSSNYNPCPVFAIGAHMVALNYQVSEPPLESPDGSVARH